MQNDHDIEYKAKSIYSRGIVNWLGAAQSVVQQGPKLSSDSFY